MKNFFLKKDKSITIKEIINFSLDIQTKEIKDNEIFITNEKIKKALDIHQNPKIDEKFFYKTSKKLKDYMAILYSCRLAGIHLCVQAPPGVGKTSSGKFLGKVLSANPKSPEFEMFSFYSGTKPNNLYGTTILKDGKICGYINGIPIYDIPIFSNWKKLE